MTPQDLRNLTWRKSTYSNGQANCVEVAPSDGSIAVRDSKDPDGSVLVFSAEEWQTFVAGITAGELTQS